MRILLAALVLVSTANAQSIPPCAAHDVMAKTLLEQAQEIPVGTGLVEGDDAVLEIYASPTGTWTAVITTLIDGQSCIKAFGNNFSPAPLPANNRDA